jgi:hypothetical protein
MSNKDDRLMIENFQNFRLPPFMEVEIYDLPKKKKGINLLTKFLCKNFPLMVNKLSFESFEVDPISVKRYLDGLLSAIPRVTNIVYLNSLSLDQEDVKQILQASFKAKCLKLKECKLRKFITNKYYFLCYTISSLIGKVENDNPRCHDYI